MKKLFAYLFVLVLFSCSKDDWEYYNPYLPDYAVNYQVNLDLPQFHQLQYGAAAVYIGGNGLGINGIILVNTGVGFVAYDATCSNHYLEDCSILSLHGLEATCNCEHALTYLLIDGNVVPDAQNPDEKYYPLKPYRVIRNGNMLLITN
ncbi:MAG TPA: hypothetical protein VKY32_07880 [Flavobacterium sp.]|nr:hypothetical protein [Flavobacterium sp.]